MAVMLIVEDDAFIFMRQLGGMIAPSRSEDSGVIFRIRRPLLLVPPGEGAARVAAWFQRICAEAISPIYRL